MCYFLPLLLSVRLFCPRGAVNTTSVDQQTDDMVAQTGGVANVCCGNGGGLILYRQQLLFHLQTFKPLTSPSTPLETRTT